MLSSPRKPRTALGTVAVCVLVLLGSAACSPDESLPQDASSAPEAHTAQNAESSIEPTRPAATAKATAPAPGEAPEAGGVEAWATQALGREKGLYYGQGWMSAAATAEADAPVPAGSYGVSLACQGAGPVEVVIGEGEDGPKDAKPASESVECGTSTTIAVELETDGMHFAFTMPDGIHLYGYKIFERAG